MCNFKFALDMSMSRRDNHVKYVRIYRCKKDGRKNMSYITQNDNQKRIKTCRLYVILTCRYREIAFMGATILPSLVIGADRKIMY